LHSIKKLKQNFGEKKHITAKSGRIHIYKPAQAYDCDSAYRYSVIAITYQRILSPVAFCLRSLFNAVNDIHKTQAYTV